MLTLQTPDQLKITSVERVTVQLYPAELFDAVIGIDVEVTADNYRDRLQEALEERFEDVWVSLNPPTHHFIERIVKVWMRDELDDSDQMERLVDDVCDEVWEKMGEWIKYEENNYATCY